MSIVAQLATELGQLSSTVGMLTKQVEASGAKMAEALGKARVQSDALGGSVRRTTNLAMGLGRGLGAYLGFGSANQAVASIFSKISQWQADRERRETEEAERAGGFTRGTRGLFDDTKGLRDALDRYAPGLPEDRKVEIARAYTQAGGPRRGRAATDAFRRTAAAASVADVFGLDPVGLAGYMGKGFAAGASNPEDLIASLIAEHGAGAGRAFDRLTPAGMRTASRRATGAWQRLVTEQSADLSEADRLELEIRRRKAQQEPNTEEERLKALQVERYGSERSARRAEINRMSTENLANQLRRRRDAGTASALDLNTLAILEADLAPGGRADPNRLTNADITSAVANSGQPRTEDGQAQPEDDLQHGRMIPLRRAPVQVEVLNLREPLNPGID